MKVQSLLITLMVSSTSFCVAQNSTENSSRTEIQKTAVVEVAPTRTSSSKELRKAEKIEANKDESILELKKKIEELEFHIKKSSENADYNSDAAKARLRHLQNELARIQKENK